MYSFNIIITELCNAKCTHCYMNADNDIKNRKTLTEQEIDFLIERLPNNTKSIVLTGGEVYMVKSLLYCAISKIRDRFPKIQLGIESNGKFFYSSKENTIKELESLRNQGVSFVRFSDDVFHEKGGIDLGKVRKIKDYGKDVGILIKYLVQDKALAIGRASEIEEQYKAVANCMNSEKSLKEPYLFLDIEGNIYSCSWKCVPPIGNIFAEEWDMIEDNLKQGIQQLILSGKIKETFKRLFSSEKDYNEVENIINNEGECMACNKIFKEGNK